jgi:hypothetical protein
MKGMNGAREIEVVAEQDGGFRYGAGSIGSIVVALGHGVLARVAAKDLPAALVAAVRIDVESDMERVAENDAAGIYDCDEKARTAAFAAVGRAIVDAPAEWCRAIASAPSFQYV